MTKKLLIALATLALAAFALAACGRRREHRPTGGDDHGDRETTAAEEPAGDGGTVAVEADPRTDPSPSPRPSSRRPPARTRSISTTRPAPPQRLHRGRRRSMVAETETVSDDERDRVRRARARHLHVLLRHPRPPRGRHGGHADGRVAEGLRPSDAAPRRRRESADAAGLLVALDLDGEAGHLLEPAAVELVDRDDLGGRADARAGRDRAPGSGPCSSRS